MPNDKIQDAIVKVSENVEGPLHFTSIGGSYCYGTEKADSDVDVRGFYILPFDDVAGILSYQENRQYNTDTVDAVFHEVGKFASLAAKANPNVLEPLFYDNPLVHPAADPLVENKEVFLSRAIHKTSVGYARSQWGKLMGFKDKERFPKYLGHVFRLLYQARDLLATGHFDPRLYAGTKAHIETLKDASLNRIYIELEELLKEIDDSLDKSPLPKEPDMQKIHEIILECRYGVSG